MKLDLKRLSQAPILYSVIAVQMVLIGVAFYNIHQSKILATYAHHRVSDTEWDIEGLKRSVEVNELKSKENSDEISYLQNQVELMQRY